MNKIKLKFSYLKIKKYQAQQDSIQSPQSHPFPDPP